MKIEAGRPRVIRKVTGKYKDAKNAGKPKKARDRRTGMEIEVVQARSVRVCTYRQCPWPDRSITGVYIKVTDPTQRGMYIAGRNVVPAVDFHPDCVPPKARRLVRFLIPTPWVMTLCENSTSTDPVKNHRSWRFTSVEAWRAAMDHHFPRMAQRWKTDPRITDLVHQVGTNNHWSMLEYKPRPWEK